MEKLNELVILAERADSVCSLMEKINPHYILAIAEAFRALDQRAEAAEANLIKSEALSESRFERVVQLQEKVDFLSEKLAELEKQEPVLYALRFKNSRGEPEKLINENCLFRDREKAAAYGLGRSYVTQQSGKIEWVPNPSLNPEVIPLYTRPAPAINLAELVLDEDGNPEGFIAWYEREFALQPFKGTVHVADCESAWRDAILRNIEEAK